MKNISVLMFCLLGLAVTMNSNIIFYPFYNFPSFPIKGILSGGLEPIVPVDCSECPEWFPLSSTMRVVLSVIWYGLLLAVSASIPLCLAKCFKSNSVYQGYKTFWLYGAFVFASLTAALTGITPLRDTNLIPFVIWYMTIAYLAILPAYLQCKYYNKP
jgi:hypothetical protein